jgi:hypothetical protein
MGTIYNFFAESWASHFHHEIFITKNDRGLGLVDGLKTLLNRHAAF